MHPEGDISNLEHSPNHKSLSYLSRLFPSSNDYIRLFNDSITLSLDDPLKLCFGTIAVILLFYSLIAPLIGATNSSGSLYQTVI